MRRFAISDMHLGHANILTFKHGGHPLRPFGSVEEMHEVMLERWNKTVRPVDKVYLLGDIVIHRRFMPLLSSFNGRKVLVRGNHDIFKLKDYLPYFEDVRGVAVFPNKFVMTHVPVHPDCLLRSSWPKNVHGHLHANVVEENVWKPEGGEWIKRPNNKYFNVNVERIDYTPIDLEAIQ